MKRGCTGLSPRLVPRQRELQLPSCGCWYTLAGAIVWVRCRTMRRAGLSGCSNNSQPKRRIWRLRLSKLSRGCARQSSRRVQVQGRSCYGILASLCSLLGFPVILAWMSKVSLPPHVKHCRHWGRSRIALYEQHWQESGFHSLVFQHDSPSGLFERHAMDGHRHWWGQWHRGSYGAQTG